MKSLTKVLGGLVAAFALTLPAQAATATLADLLAGQTITAGDKLFDKWTLGGTMDGIVSEGYYSSDYDRTFNAANITVTSLDDGGDNPGPGLSFSVLNGELSIGGDGIFAYIDLMFGFRVTPAADKQIKDVSMGAYGAYYSYDSTATGNGPEDAGSYIHESVGTAADLDDLAALDVEWSYLDPDGHIGKTDDAADFAPQDEIWVTKNILVWALAETDGAGVFGFEQRFSQQDVPEPGSLALVALALAGLGVAARRHRG